MNNQFCYCPNCGVRNFSNDEICGVCKSKLIPIEVIEKNNVTKKEVSNSYYIIILLIVIAVIVFLFHNAFEKEATEISDKIKSVKAQPIVLNIPKTFKSNPYEKPIKEYTLLIINRNDEKVFNVEVHIKNKLENIELLRLASIIKLDIDAISNKGVVFFLLPEMKASFGAWAAVNYYPEEEVRILGQSIADEEKIKANLDKISDYVGLWQDNNLKGDLIIRIRKDKVKGYLSEYISSTDYRHSDLPIPLTMKIKNGKKIFINSESTSEYSVIESNGNLTTYDSHGFVGTLIKLK